MKRFIAIVVFIGMLVSCNSTDKTKLTIEVPSEIETSIDSIADAVNKRLTVIDTDEALIATALMAAPKESRSECTVIGYNMAGEFVTLKKGTNEFICLADNPKQDGFNAACYHKDLEPFMARGRALKAEGKTGQEIFDIREKEVKSGQLEIKSGLALHIYYGANTLYDPETSKVGGALYRYVVYMPWATAESTGLPNAPIARNHPWIMNPGTHRAHIMISPVKGEGE
ncbi:MAG: hypothetical protein V3V00_14060 [Saprospiraceae bacterium]